MLPIQPPLIRSFFTGKKTVVSPEFHEAFFLSWEDALWQLLRFHRIKSGSTVLVPSFFCWDVVENMRAHGLSPVIYEIDKFLQPNRADFEAKLRTKLPTVIVLFHAVGISNPLLQDTNWLKMVPKNTIIIEDAVHRVIDPSQVTLIAPNHYLIDSLRKVSPLQGSRVFSQHLVPQPTMIDTLQTAGYRIKVLVWWLVMQIWLLLAYWAKQKTFQRFANRQAEIAMQRGYDLIGDHRLPSSAPRLFQALATRLNLDLIKQTNQRQAKLYHQLLENLWTKPGIIKIPMKQADWQELRGF
ncbi:hypothetical protein KC921_03990, partial [Candidatus Woesebacteria bacterium]|nr:hypothetical protein [Candidatus Woesebacteria bacterium]